MCVWIIEKIMTIEEKIYEDI